MNSAVILISIIGIGAAILAIIALKSTRRDNTKSLSPLKPKKFVKLFTKDGALLYEYKDVYLSHWDKNIYHLSYKYEGKSFMRIHKGSDMLLLSENYIDANKIENNTHE
jgi:hypothetical protein